jgi:hypothetical protein
VSARFVRETLCACCCVWKGKVTFERNINVDLGAETVFGTSEWFAYGEMVLFTLLLSSEQRGRVPTRVSLRVVLAVIVAIASLRCAKHGRIVAVIFAAHAFEAHVIFSLATWPPCIACMHAGSVSEVDDCNAVVRRALRMRLP